MRVKAPELLAVDEFRIDKLLNFEDLGITLIDDKRVAKAGKLNIVHGHEFGRVAHHLRSTLPVVFTTVRRRQPFADTTIKQANTPNAT